jgi:sialate O-acetylesterase
MTKTILSACLLLHSIVAAADVRLPAVIGPHMVLQQSTDVTLWGWCDPNEKIEVRTTWDTTTYTTRGLSDATWQLKIKTPKAGGPYSINVKGNNAIAIDDVLIGEVWLCSGQSNMEWAPAWGLPYEKEVAEATNKNIRFFHVPRTTALYPQNDVRGRWVVCTPEEMKKFSAVAYFFGQQLTDKLKAPVGLIGSSWGGTPAEVWTPDSVVKSNPQLADAAAKLKPAAGWPVKTALTYNAMIYPLMNFPIAGSIWYQGESNVGTASTYQSLLTGMIDSWRRGWKKDFPFYLVQIAPFAGYGNFPSGALLREQQTKAAAHPNTGMIVIHDLVDDIKDIHPKLKKEVGQRLAAMALTKTYGLKGYASSYPQYQGMQVEKNKVRIRFTNADAGLMVKGKEATDFWIAGEDKKFVPAKVRVDGNTVIVWSDAVKKPAAVRFGLSNTAMPNLFSKEGLPVNIFRTDEWEPVAAEL